MANAEEIPYEFVDPTIVSWIDDLCERVRGELPGDEALVEDVLREMRPIGDNAYHTNFSEADCVPRCLGLNRLNRFPESVREVCVRALSQSQDLFGWIRRCVREYEQAGQSQAA